MHKFSISLLPLSEYCRTTTGIYELHEREPIRQTDVLGELTEGPGAGPVFRHCRSSRSHNHARACLVQQLNSKVSRFLAISVCHTTIYQEFWLNPKIELWEQRGGEPCMPKCTGTSRARCTPHFSSFKIASRLRRAMSG